MCTAATYKTDGFYFGRTLDYEFSYGDEICVMPRRFPLEFGSGLKLKEHFAVIGMAHVADGYPLYYDGMNERGLCMAGLNFVGNAVYAAPRGDGSDVAQFEFIPWVLAQCESVAQARELLGRINLTGTPFSDKLPTAQLHWIIADRTEAITVESVRDGLKIYDNPVGVLTNNPPFEQQMQRLCDYMALSPRQPENRFCRGVELSAYSRGMGALGLPGDLSSASRFARVAFTRANSVSASDEASSVSQFFHILGSVEQQRGCCEVAEGEYEITLYTSCCSADKGIYYYTTYDNSRINAVDMNRCELDSNELIRFTPRTQPDVYFQN